MPCSYEKTLLPTLLAVANTSAHGENRITACSSSTPRWNSSDCTSAGTAGFQPLPVAAEMDSAEQEGCGAAQAKHIGDHDGNTDGRQMKKQLTVLVGSFTPEPLCQARLVVHSRWVTGS